MLKKLLIIFSLALCAIFVVAADATMIVVPNSLSNVEGNSSSPIPFDRDTFWRHQQVFGSTQFGTVPGYITQIIFRPDASGASFTTTYTSIQINLSTTPKVPDGLSITFANNIGTDDTVVYPQGSLTLSSSFTGPSGEPKDFDIIINLTQSFLYDPSKGNLLLDIINYDDGGINATDFDTQLTGGDSISRVYKLGSSNVIANTNGLITEFNFQPLQAIPEPSTIFLLTAGLGGIVTLGIGKKLKTR